MMDNVKEDMQKLLKSRTKVLAKVRKEDAKNYFAHSGDLMESGSDSKCKTEKPTASGNDATIADNHPQQEHRNNNDDEVFGENKHKHQAVDFFENAVPEDIQKAVQLQDFNQFIAAFSAFAQCDKDKALHVFSIGVQDGHWAKNMRPCIFGS